MNLILQDIETPAGPQGKESQQVLFQWSHPRVPSTDNFSFSAIEKRCAR